jgi:hypothetical protein
MGETVVYKGPKARGSRTTRLRIPTDGKDLVLPVGAKVDVESDAIIARLKDEKDLGGEHNFEFGAATRDERFVSEKAEAAARELGLTDEQIDELDGTGADGKIKVDDVRGGDGS